MLIFSLAAYPDGTICTIPTINYEHNNTNEENEFNLTNTDDENDFISNIMNEENDFISNEENDLINDTDEENCTPNIGKSSPKTSCKFCFLSL